jgi:hypothetical protein
MGIPQISGAVVPQGLKGCVYMSRDGQRPRWSSPLQVVKEKRDGEYRDMLKPVSNMFDFHPSHCSPQKNTLHSSSYAYQQKFKKAQARSPTF